MAKGWGLTGSVSMRKTKLRTLFFPTVCEVASHLKRSLDFETATHNAFPQ